MKTCIPLRSVVHIKRTVPHVAKKVSASLVPVSFYNFCIDHHQISIQEVSKTFIDTTSVEILGLLSSGMYKGLLQIL